MPFIEDENGLAIYFTRDEWKSILGNIQYAVHYGSIPSDEDAMDLNIIDRIEKHLGIE